MLLATDYPFLGAFGTLLGFFFLVIWFWLLITCFSDLFRRRDVAGGRKLIWIVFLIFVPYFGVFAYLLANHDGLADRSARQAQAQQQRPAGPAANGNGGVAAEIGQAKQLLDSGAISPAEYEQLKQKALA